MTSRDFRLIADTIARMDPKTRDRQAIAQDFADALASTNRRFDRWRFVAAATGQPVTPGDKPRARDYRR